mgnify:CR=1 FL=1
MGCTKVVAVHPEIPPIKKGDINSNKVGISNFIYIKYFLKFYNMNEIMNMRSINIGTHNWMKNKSKLWDYLANYNKYVKIGNLENSRKENEE